MRDQTGTPGGPDAGPVEPPKKCPECGATDLTTASKVANAESYWRCNGCGEVWNVGRLNAASRYVGFGSYRR